jgi:putative phosphoribosyl transferase
MTTSSFLDDDDLLEPRVESLLIPGDGTLLHADLVLPAGATALVVFAHGTGSSRNSPRNRFVAGVLKERGLGTLLFDLLTSLETCLDAVDLRLRLTPISLERRPSRRPLCVKDGSRAIAARLRGDRLRTPGA